MLDALLFQIIWCACLFGGNAWAWPLTLLNILFHLFLLKTHQRNLGAWLTFVSLMVAVGVGLDLLKSRLGLFAFPDTQHIPLWLVCLWINYWMTWHWSLHWLSRIMPYTLCIGAIGGAYAYFIGYYLEKVDWPYGLPLTLSGLVLSWGLSTYIGIRIKRQYPL